MSPSSFKPASDLQEAPDSATCMKASARARSSAAMPAHNKDTADAKREIWQRLQMLHSLGSGVRCDFNRAMMVLQEVCRNGLHI